MSQVHEAVGDLAAKQDKLTERVDTIDKRIIIMVAGSAGAGTAVVQILAHLFGLK